MEKAEKLQNWKNINIENIIENLNIEEIHNLSVFSDYNDSIMIWEDGEISVLGSNTTPNTNRWYAIINAEGRGNVDESLYAEGWAEEELDEDEYTTGSYIETETGKVMTADEMITECIKTGDWSEYENWVRDKIREQYENDIQNLEDMIDQSF